MEIKLRGSEADIIKWRVLPFRPGTCFWLPKKLIKNKEHNPLSTYASFYFPYRIAPIILDLSYFTPSTCYKQVHSMGAGEVTIGIKNYLKLEIELTLNKDKIRIKGSRRKVILKHGLLIFRRVINKSFGAKIRVKEPKQLIHSGLGTTATLFSGLMISLNYMFGRPINWSTLCKLVCLNYGEEAGKLLFPGFTTGGAYWNSLLGGFNIVSKDFRLIFHAKLPQNLRVAIGIPKQHKGKSSQKSFEMKIFDLVRKYDRFDAGKISYWILMRLLPAIIEKDLEKIGEILWDININTAKSIPPIFEYRFFKIFPLMSELKDLIKCEVVFLTSAGPSIVCITSDDSKLRKAIDIFEKYDFSYIHTAIENRGGRLFQDKLKERIITKDFDFAYFLNL